MLFRAKTKRPNTPGAGKGQKVTIGKCKTVVSVSIIRSDSDSGLGDGESKRDIEPPKEISRATKPAAK